MSLLCSRRRFAAILFAAFLLSIPLPGRAQNISLVGYHKPAQANSGFGDVWAEGNIACMGTWTAYSTFGIGIYDISNPALPTLLTVHNFSSNLGNQFEQGVIRDRIMYVGSWGNGNSGSGLHILSLTNPASPVLLSRITASSSDTVTNGFNAVHTMWLERDFLYEAAHVNGIQTVKIFNVANPHAPFFLWDVMTTNTLRVHQITVAKKGTNSILYTSGWGNSSGTSPGQTDIWDVSNVGTQPPQWLGRIFSGFSSHSSWPTPDGNALVVCRETTGGEVTIYDITTPTNPVPLSVISPASIGLEPSIPHNPVIISNLLFLSWYQNGLQIFDITDRTKPVRVGSYDTYAPTGTSSFQGNWGIYPDLGLNKVLVSDINNGFYILDASAVLTGTNNYPPLLVKSPTNQIVAQGTVATFAPVVTGSLLKYQWRFNGAPLANATNSNLTLNNVLTNQAGSYTVIVSNTFGMVTSAVANLSVVISSNTPVFAAHPQSVSVYPGQPATFSVALVGSGPFSYQWHFKGSDIPSATADSFTVGGAQFANVGHYSVLVGNSAGSVVSSNALLSIIDSPYINSVHFASGLRNAVIRWNTTVPTDGRIDYGPTSAGGVTASSYTEPELSTNHVIQLTGLATNTTYSFQIISRAGGSNYISGVYQFTTAGTITLDNMDWDKGVSFVGTWNSSVSVSGYYFTNYQFANTISTSQPPTRLFTFAPTIPVPGKYDVQVRHTSATDRSSNAPFTISYSGGIITNRMNQRANGGLWLPLATNLPFVPGTNGFVRLANNAPNSVVIADAVRFIYLENQDSPTNNSIPTWWSDLFFGTESNPDTDPDGDGFTTGQEYILGTSPLAANQTFSVETFRSGGTANIIFWPMLSDRSYTLMQSSDLSSGWQPVLLAPESGGPNGEGVFSLSLASTNQAFYRISVALDPSGGSPRAALQAFRPFTEYEGEASCGPNRIYVQ